MQLSAPQSHDPHSSAHSTSRPRHVPRAGVAGIAAAGPAARPARAQTSSVEARRLGAALLTPVLVARRRRALGLGAKLVEERGRLLL